jgi:hypothetical protein
MSGKSHPYTKWPSVYCQRCGRQGDLPVTVERSGDRFRFCSVECADQFAQETDINVHTNRSRVA